MFPRCVVFAQSVSGEAFGDCFVIIMVCSLGVTPDGMRENRQGVSCGKDVLIDLINVGNVR